MPGAEAAAAQGETVQVRTDLVLATINTVGGTLQRLELLKHKAQADENKNFVLLGRDYNYEAESGLIGEGLPNHRTIWRILPGPRELRPAPTSSSCGLPPTGLTGCRWKRCIRSTATVT